MRTLTVFLILALSTLCHAAPNCEDVFTVSFIEPSHGTNAQKLEQLYATSKVLGFANPDHDHKTTFSALIDFLAIHGRDPQLKSVTVELSNDLRVFLEKASVVAPTNEDTLKIGNWADYITQNEEPSFIVNQLLPVIRKINASRPQDPLLVVGVDSITLARGLDFNFMSSIDREVGTALNFDGLVRQRWPNQKHIVVYQDAHLLRNLTAKGLRDGKQIDAPLAWVEFVPMMDPAFAQDYKVALFDTTSAFNPAGAIDRSSPDSKFTDVSFLSQYRGGTVHRTDPTKSIADALLWNAQP